MARCVQSRCGEASKVRLASLLSTLVTVAKVDGVEEEWQYSFYNVRVDSEVTNIRVRSKTKLPGVYRDGFSLGCGDILHVEELPRLTGIDFDQVETIGNLADCVNEKTLGRPKSMRFVISALELYGLHIDDMLPLLETLEDVWSDVYGPGLIFDDDTTLEMLAAEKQQRHPRPNVGHERSYKLHYEARRRFREMLTGSTPGVRLPLDERSKGLARLGQFGSGELKDVVHSLPKILLSYVVTIIKQREADLELNELSSQWKRIPIPLREMGNPRLALMETFACPEERAKYADIIPTPPLPADARETANPLLQSPATSESPSQPESSTTSVEGHSDDMSVKPPRCILPHPVTIATQLSLACQRVATNQWTPFRLKFKQFERNPVQIG